MRTLTTEIVTEHLKSVPGLTPGMISGVAIDAGKVVFAIEIDPAKAKQFEPIRLAAEAAVKKIPGVVSVVAVLTAEKNAPPDGSSIAGLHSHRGPLPRGEIGRTFNAGDRRIRLPA